VLKIFRRSRRPLRPSGREECFVCFSKVWVRCAAWRSGRPDVPIAPRPRVWDYTESLDGVLALKAPERSCLAVWDSDERQPPSRRWKRLLASRGETR